jgi:hypothetical protein
MRGTGSWWRACRLYCVMQMRTCPGNTARSAKMAEDAPPTHLRVTVSSPRFNFVALLPRAAPASRLAGTPRKPHRSRGREGTRGALLLRCAARREGRDACARRCHPPARLGGGVPQPPALNPIARRRRGPAAVRARTTAGGGTCRHAGRSHSPPPPPGLTGAIGRCGGRQRCCRSCWRQRTSGKGRHRSVWWAWSTYALSLTTRALSHPLSRSDGASRKCGFLLQHTGRPLGGGLLAVLTPRPRYSTSQLGVVRLASARLTGGTRWG